MFHVKVNLFTVVSRLQQHTGRRYSDAGIAKAAQISRSTVGSLMRGETTRIDTVTIERLLAFFEAEGMPIGVGDLFTVERAG